MFDLPWGGMTVAYMYGTNKVLDGNGRFSSCTVKMHLLALREGTIQLMMVSEVYERTNYMIKDLPPTIGSKHFKFLK